MKGGYRAEVRREGEEKARYPQPCECAFSKIQYIRKLHTKQYCFVAENMLPSVDMWTIRQIQDGSFAASHR